MQNSNANTNIVWYNHCVFYYLQKWYINLSFILSMYLNNLFTYLMLMTLHRIFLKTFHIFSKRNTARKHEQWKSPWIFFDLEFAYLSLKSNCLNFGSSVKKFHRFQCKNCVGFHNCFYSVFLNKNNCSYHKRQNTAECGIVIVLKQTVFDVCIVKDQILYLKKRDTICHLTH